MEANEPPPFIVDGVVAPSHANATKTSHVVFADPSEVLGGLIFQADEATFVEQEFYGPVGDALHKVKFHYADPGRPGSTKPPRAGPAEPVTLRSVLVRVLAAHAYPEMLIRQGGWDGWLRGATDATRCTITAGTHDSHPFPSDPARDPQSQKDLWPHGNDLRADCHIERAVVDEDHGPNGTTIAYVHGLEIQVASLDTGETRNFTTGTFPDSVNGVPTGETYTRLLKIDQVRGWRRLEMAFPVNVTAYSPRMAVAGTLHVGATQGRLEWGEHRRDGALEAFAARGAFSVERRSERVVNVDGHTTHAALFTLQSEALWPPAAAWIGVAAIAAVAAVSLLAWLWSLYSRLEGTRLLDHPRRARILELVRRSPGVETNTVARTLGLGWALTLYHISTLRRGGILVVHRVGGRTALFPANAGFRGREAAVVLLRRGSHRRLYDLIVSAPGSDQASLARALEVTRARVSQVVSELREAGLIECRRRGRRQALFAKTAATGVL